MMGYTDRVLRVNNLEAAYIEGGAGYPLLLIHGSGPGASTIGNWRRILEPLAQDFHVHAMDLIGFGRSARKTEEPFFDPDLWLQQCQALLGKMPGERIGVIAHSLSAVLAFRLAAKEARVAQVLTTGAMGASFRANENTIACWTFPETREALRATAESLIFDRSLIDDAYLSARMSILHADPDYRAYFTKMFEGNRQHFVDVSVLSDDTLAQVTCPVTMLHGRADTAFPPEITLSVAQRLPQADVQLLANCSHSIAMERPDTLLSAARELFPSQ
jgi:2-hydroxymuconate-semialdehyde hydrolase